MQRNILFKGWGIKDLHSAKGSNGSLFFYEDLHRRFHILISNKKISTSLIFRTEI